jgi:hypothetical protein
MLIIVNFIQKLKVILVFKHAPHHADVCGDMFITSTLDADEWSGSLLCHFTPGKSPPSIR